MESSRLPVFLLLFLQLQKSGSSLQSFLSMAPSSDDYQDEVPRDEIPSCGPEGMCAFFLGPPALPGP